MNSLDDYVIVLEYYGVLRRGHGIAMMLSTIFKFIFS
jgi:hypothetical protein